MTEAHKIAMCAPCGLTGPHLGPFDPGGPNDPDDAGGECWGCGRAHVEEFGDCIGIVDGPLDLNNAPKDDAPCDPTWIAAFAATFVDVRWQPSGLRYAYELDQLVKV